MESCWANSALILCLHFPILILILSIGCFLIRTSEGCRSVTPPAPPLATTSCPAFSKIHNHRRYPSTAIIDLVCWFYKRQRVAALPPSFEAMKGFHELLVIGLGLLLDPQLIDGETMHANVRENRHLGVCKHMTICRGGTSRIAGKTWGGL